MDPELTLLWQKKGEHQRLTERRDKISANIATMEHLLPELERSVRAERADVDRMESGGLTSFVYGILGRQEEKLDKERREAAEAERKYADALRTLQGLHKELEDLNAAIAALGGAAEAYRRAFGEKRQRMLEGNTPGGQRLRRLEEEARQLRAVEKELIEAQNAGEMVLSKVSDIEDSLQSASNWGMVDMFSDSFFADMGKYGKMDDAQRQMEELNRLLGRFSRELQDLNVNFDLSADIGGGMRFADFFFDNIFTDAMAYQRIEKLRDQVRNVRFQTEKYMDMLSRKRSSLQTTLEEKRKEAEELILRDT